MGLMSAVLALEVVGQVPTWNDDISCIVYTHCTPCHHDGGAGHFSLTSYTDAAFWRNEMRAATQVRFMPPWPPDENYRPLAHERSLSQEEIDLVAAWVNGGYPEGDPANALPTPVYDDGPQISDPNISVIMEDYVIPFSSADNYRCFVMPVLNNPTDRFITGMEVIPGNREMVHHALIFQDVTGQARELDDATIEPGYASFGGIGVPGAKLIGVWVPGSQPFFTASGMGIKLEANADIVVQIHYPPNGEVQVDSTRINLQMSDDPDLRELLISSPLTHTAPSLQNGPLVIPADEIRIFHNRYTLPVGITTTGIGPHAHLICTSMSSYAVKPNGDTIPLIDIPDWDFMWQGFYDFRNPIFLPQGTVLHGYATYDNTVNNPQQPNSPPQTVSLGEGTADEMMLFYFAYTVPGTPADEQIVIDDGSGPEYYLDCQVGLSIAVGTVPGGSEIAAWPSPASEVLNLSGLSIGALVRLLDLTGKCCLEQLSSTAVDRLAVNELAPGTYLLEIIDAKEGMILRKKIIID